MRTMVRKGLWLFGVLAVLATACKDKEAEKKIAALEARLSELEGKKGSGPTPVAPGQEAPQAEVKPDGPLPEVKFEALEHDFGTINEGQKVTHTYKFTNTGAAPLIIQSAQPTCGCTVSDYSKDPIPVGGTGFVTAEFDSHGKTGVQNKTVTVTANTWPKQTTLRFKAMVTPAAESSGPVKR
jgi:hypothetical protein